MNSTKRVTSHELQTSDRVIRHYDGNGQIFLESGHALECTYDAIQLTSGSLQIVCEIDFETVLHLSESFSLDLFFRQDVVRFKGEVRTGYQIHSDKLSVESVSMHQSKDAGRRVQLTLGCREMNCAHDNQVASPSLVRFQVTNLTIRGTESFTEVTPFGDQSSRLQLPLTLDGYHFLVRPVFDYRDRVSVLRSTKRVDVTCELLVGITSFDQVESIQNIANAVVRLLTLARGCRVEWLCYDVEDTEGRVLLSYHRNAITRPYGTLRLIAEEPPEDTKLFVESTYPRLQAKEESWKLGNSIDGYTDGKAEGDFLEARALKLSIVCEYLRAAFLEAKGQTHILPSDHFDRKIKTLKEKVELLVAELFEESTPVQRKLMANHALGLNWYPFGRALGELCNELGLDATSKDRRRFVEIRNALVHRMDFPESAANAWHQYLFMVTFVGKLLLAILEYDGYFCDWSRHVPGQTLSESDLRTKLDLKSRRQQICS